MDHSSAAATAGTDPKTKIAEEAALLCALEGADEDGEWVEGVSLWSDYMTVIDVHGNAGSPMRWAS